MGKPAVAQLADSHIRSGKPAANYQEHLQRHNQFARNDQIHAKDALEERWRVTADDTNQIVEQHQHLCEHSNFFHVKAAYFKHEPRDPNVESPTGRFGDKTRQCDVPKLAVVQDFPGAHFLTIIDLMLGFLAAQDVILSFFLQFLLVFLVIIEL